MTTTLLHSPADIIRQLLVDIGQGIDVVNPQNNTPWQTFATREPSTPDDCLTVYNTSPQDDGRSMVTGEEFFHYGFQIRVRSTDPTTGFLKSFNIRKALAENVYLKQVNVDSSPYLVHCLAKMNLLDLGKNVPNTLRNLHTINGLVTLRDIDPLRRNLSAWYKLDEPQGKPRLDSSGNTVTLSETGGTVPSATGLIGNAAGPFNVTATNLTSTTGPITAAPFSLSCFVKLNNMTSQMVFGQADPLVNMFQGFLLNGDGSVSFRCNQGSNGTLTSAPGVVATGSWYNLAETYDGTTIRGYVNKVLVAKGSKTGGNFSKPIFVGGITALYLQGLVDLAGAWMGRVLSDGELTTVGQSATSTSDIGRLFNNNAGLDYPFS